MSDDKSGSDDLDAMLEELEEEAASEGGGDISDDEMAELEKALAESPSPKEEAEAAKKKSGNKPTLADELEEDELEGLDVDIDVPDESDGSPEEAELPDDLDLGGGEKQPEEQTQQSSAERSSDTSPSSAETKTKSKEPAEEISDGKSDNPPAQSEGESAPAEQGAEKQQTSDAQSDQQEESSTGSKWAGRTALLTLKWTAYSIPSIALFWVLGSYLARWVTAGWLIGAVSLLVTLGIPMLAYDAVGRRGLKRWWFAGSGVLLTALLVAPVPTTAGAALSHHGYWPGEMTEEFGMGDDNVVARATWSLGQRAAGVLGTSVAAADGYTALGAAPAAKVSDDDAQAEDSADAAQEKTERPSQGGSESTGGNSQESGESPAP